MAQSAEWKSMCLELRKSTVPGLRKIGFIGSFPHFCRAREGKIELISFLSHSNAGGAFEVGASVIFPDAAGTKKSYLFYPDAEINPKELIWGAIQRSWIGILKGNAVFVCPSLR